jgi:hypothetical protein
MPVGIDSGLRTSAGMLPEIAGEKHNRLTGDRSVKVPTQIPYAYHSQIDSFGNCRHSSGIL